MTTDPWGPDDKPGHFQAALLLSEMNRYLMRRVRKLKRKLRLAKEALMDRPTPINPAPTFAQAKEAMKREFMTNSVVLASHLSMVRDVLLLRMETGAQAAEIMRRLFDLEEK